MSGRVLVVGLGISGIATAVRLRAAGWRPVIVERAPQRRSGGYFIALFGAGRTAADRLGFLDRLHDRGTKVRSADVDRRGRNRPGLSFGDAPGHPWLMLRSDVERAAFAALGDDVEIRYATVPAAIEQDADGVEVTLRDTAAGTSTTERFDLVVGADGLRSTVRSLVFGPHERYLHPMNYMIAAYEYRGTPPGLLARQGATLLEPGRSATVFAFTDHDPTVMLTYRTADVAAEFARPPVESLRAAFGPAPLGPLLDDLLTAAGTADGLLFDSVEQVRMDTWHRGRVVLVGDAAWCVTLYAGMGVSAGLAGAELLGALLERHPGDLGTALAGWERALRPVLADYQQLGYAQRPFFVQESRGQIALRRTVTRLRAHPAGRRLIARLPIARDSGSKDADIVGAALSAAPDGTEIAAHHAA